MTGRVIGLLVAAVLLTGCGLIPRGGVASTPEVPLPYPAGCAAFELSPRRCQAILNWVVAQTGSSGRALTAVELLGDLGCGNSDPNVLCKNGGGRLVVRMRLHFADGGSAEQSVGCGIDSQYSILCTETPEIRVGSIADGYRDVPCGNENGVGCGSPLPSGDPAALAAARPLRMPALDIPIDHIGHYQFDVGQATLPNGVLGAAEFRLANHKTQAVLVTEDGVSLRIRSADPAGKPFENYYLRGWHPGPEDVIVSLQFDVMAFDPGALLQVRDLVVQ
ncbi:MAG: hypothetical protein M3067_07420 [Chloroflexota bacterium]|nr:hypothetical protein [Chloroflexota bacterium]